MHGNNQAVRIPQEFRLDLHCVEISRNAQGDFVIQSLKPDRSAAVLETLAGFADDVVADFVADFVVLLKEDRRDPQPMPDREGL